MVIRRKNARPGATHKPPPAVKPKSDAREDQFVARYLTHRNGTRAAIEVGYAASGAHVEASRLLKRPKIAAAIARYDAARERRLAARYDVTAEKITRELAKIGFATIADYGHVDHEGEFRIDMTDTPEEAFAALSSIKTKRTTRTIGDVDIEDVTTELRLGAKREALVDLGKITGLFKDGVDVTIPVQFNIYRTSISMPDPEKDAA